jgi:hypothetical protein
MNQTIARNQIARPQSTGRRTKLSKRGRLALIRKRSRRVEKRPAVRERHCVQTISKPPRPTAVAENPIDPEVGAHRARPQMPPEMAFYRPYTEALLDRYLRISMETGKAPSLLGREMFRAQVTHYTVEGFDDSVIFCIDI